MRKAPLIAAIMFMLALAMAAQVTKHDISITVKEDGSAYVEEEFLLRLSEADKELFTNAMAQEPQTMDAWSPLGIRKSLATNAVTQNVIPESTQSEFAVVTFQYTTGRIVEGIEDKGKERIVGITEKLFTFYDGSRVSLPFNPPTELYIRIPEKFKLADEPVPPAYGVTRHFGSDGLAYTQYEWSYRRPFSSDKFRLLYKEELSLQSQLSPEELLHDFEERFGSPIYLLAGVIVLAIALLYRRELALLVTESFAGEPVFEDDSEEAK